VPSNLNAVLADTLALYNGLFSQIRIEAAVLPRAPPVRLTSTDPPGGHHLVDNSIEAMGVCRRGRGPAAVPSVTIETQHDAANAVARIVISDKGPGVPRRP